MKYPRNARIFRGHLDAAPFLGVVFLVVIFFGLQSSMVFTPGVKINLPVQEGLAGTGNPAVAVAVDLAGQFYFENQAIAEAGLRDKLKATIKGAKSPMALIIEADEGVGYEVIVRLSKLARELGFREALLATRPKVFAPSANPAR